MKTAHVGKSIVILVALLCNSCAIESSEPEPDSDSVAEPETSPFLGSDERQSGPRCAPVLAKDEDGNLYLKELLCPLPSKPLPDPEAAGLENKHGEWVSGGESTNDTVH